jgi:hypothetical protein
MADAARELAIWGMAPGYNSYSTAKSVVLFRTKGASLALLVE